MSCFRKAENGGSVLAGNSFQLHRIFSCFTSTGKHMADPCVDIFRGELTQAVNQNSIQPAKRMTLLGKKNFFFFSF